MPKRRLPVLGTPMPVDGFAEAASSQWLSREDEDHLDLWRRLMTARERGEAASREFKLAYDKLPAHFQTGLITVFADPTEKPADVSTTPADPEFAPPTVGSRKMRLEPDDALAFYRWREKSLATSSRPYGEARLEALLELTNSVCRLAELQADQNKAYRELGLDRLGERNDQVWTEYTDLEAEAHELSCASPIGLAIVCWIKWRAEHDDGESFDGAPANDEFYIRILSLLVDRVPPALGDDLRKAIQRRAP